MDIVLDASVGVKWFSSIKEKNVEIALDIYNQKISGNIEILVPDLLFLEIVNAFLTKSRFDIEDINIIEKSLYKMNLNIIYPDHELLKKATEIAYNLNLTIYDSLYVAIAEANMIPLITEDKKILSGKSKYNFIKSLEEYKLIS